MNTAAPAECVDSFLGYALLGASKAAARLTLDLLDAGVPEDAVISDLLAGSQYQVGELWHRDRLSVAEEHLATGATETALHALATSTATPDGPGRVVVACAEGDWHGLAADMFAQQLRGRGFAVAFLGASTPAEHVARFVERHRPDALAVSCNVPLFYAGVARLADAAHQFGVPVLAGGRALAGRTESARRLGADAGAANVDEAVVLLDRWRADRPTPSRDAARLDADAVELAARAGELAADAFEDLFRKFPALARYEPHQVARTREDLVFIAQFVAAAQLVDNDGVFIEFVDWLAELLLARHVPIAALVAGIEALLPRFETVSSAAGDLGERALVHLAAGAWN